MIISSCPSPMCMRPRSSVAFLGCRVSYRFARASPRSRSVRFLWNSLLHQAGRYQFLTAIAQQRIDSLGMVLASKQQLDDLQKSFSEVDLVRARGTLCERRGGSLLADDAALMRLAERGSQVEQKAARSDRGLQEPRRPRP
jgi:hypothetical protein